LAADRRRPGRVEYDDPALIELLRTSGTGVQADEEEDQTDHDLAPARGLVFGLLIGVSMWTAIGMIALLIHSG